MNQLRFISPIGEIVLQANDRGLTNLDIIPSLSIAPTFSCSAPYVHPAPHRLDKKLIKVKNPHILTAYQQIVEYFAMEREHFSLALAPYGTPFRQAVWQELTTIPYGHTRSYQQIATALGKDKAARAVGGANHHNPISLIIPCHRVIGSNGKLVGYAHGLSVKQWLLNFERQKASKHQR